MAIDHVSIGVSDMTRAKTFYDAALAPLDVVPIWPFEIDGRLAGVGYGRANKPFFWIQLLTDARPAATDCGLHIAFSAATRAAVDAFHAAALAHGGADDGPPGLRPHYHPTYYAAFVRDPDGAKIEAVCHKPE